MPMPVKTVADRALSGTEGPAFRDLDGNITALATGRFVFTWTYRSTDGTDDNAFARVFNTFANDTGNGNFMGNSVSIDERYTTSAGFPGGGLRVVVWAEATDAAPNDHNLYFEVRGTFGGGAGTSVIGRTLLPSSVTATDNVVRPEVVALNDARFAVAWINRTTERVQVSVYELDGTFVGGSTLNTAAATQNLADDGLGERLGMTVLSNGNFVVSWYENGSPQVNKFRILNSSGTPVTGEILNAPAGGVPDYETRVEALADGRFVLVAYDNGALGVVGRIYENDGTLVGGAFTILAGFGVGNIPEYPDVTALHDGRFMVAAQRSGDIVARVFTADGVADGAEFTVNTVTTGTQSRVSLDTLADGRVVVSWTTNETGDTDIRATVYDPRERTVYLSGTGGDDELIGSAFGDQLAGGNGDDLLAGGGAGDQLTGGAGEDALQGDDGDDYILGEGDADYLQGGNGQDTMYGGLGRDSMFGDAQNDYMVGNQGGDAMYGGSGNEVIIGDEEGGGGFGFDYIEGGSGDDLIFGCGGNDTLLGDISGGLGIGNDTLYGMLGDDTAYGGIGADVIYGGDGGDTLYGNEDGDYIVGELGNDFIEGGAGNDILLGDNEGGSGTGNDTINGGAGQDQIYLGAGGDAVRFDQAGAANADQVFNFTSSQDKIALSYGAFGAADQGGFVVRFVGGPGATANTASATILYDTNTGSLLYDADGNGGGAAVIIATFSSVPTLAAGDIVFY